MNSLVAEALGAWGLEGAACRLVAARENAVYEVVQGSRRLALRVHRQGYRSDGQLQSELAWMAAVAAGGLSVPDPVPARDGALMCRIGDTQVDVLTWLTGDTMTDALSRGSKQRRADLFHRLGHEMARLHVISDAWTVPDGFERPIWDRDGLLGETPLWDRFWDNPALAPADRDLLLRFRAAAWDRLDGMQSDFGLIHADLVPANVLVDGDDLRLIDFDDGGYGHRLFDVATVLLKHLGAEDHAQLQEALVTGYRTVRPLETEALDLFLALRAATYVGWNITRMSEQDGHARNARFIAALRPLVERCLLS